MCFIFASQRATREPIANASDAPATCQFCKGENCVDTFLEKRVTYLYGCCPTKPQEIRGHHCRQCGKEWYQGDVQEVVYTQTPQQQPDGGVVIVTGKAVTEK